MRKQATSRRRFLYTAGAVAVLPALPARRARAASLKPVNFRLDWIFQGPNAGFLIARDKGFYEQAGLDVDIGPGKGSRSTARLVGTKAAQHGFAASFAVSTTYATSHGS